MNLTEWSVNYVKHRDLLDRKLLDFEIKDSTIKFRFKDKEVYYFIEDTLGEDIFKRFEKKEPKTIVCNHNQQNFDFLVNNWNDFAKIENLVIIFYNEKNQDKWLINPFMHNKIADSKKLKQGLKALYDAAEGKVFL
jgi:hypothetical protein